MEKAPYIPYPKIKSELAYEKAYNEFEKVSCRIDKYSGKSYRWQGPYIQGQPERGYGGEILYRIRGLRIALSNYELSTHVLCGYRRMYDTS